MSDNYLEHHGILGQRWGVRRYQNTDGSLTEAGRRHYGSERKTIKATGEPRRKKLTDEQKAKINKALRIGAEAAGVCMVAYGGYKLSSNPKVIKAVSKGKEILKKEAADYKKITKESAKQAYKGFKEGVTEGAHSSGKTVGKVIAGGVTWMAGIEVADLMTNGAATSKILTAYNDHQKKDSKVKTSYRKRTNNSDYD